MIYTSYFKKVPELIECGIEPVAVSRSIPKGLFCRRLMSLAPTWGMLRMSDEQYDIEYEKILQKHNPEEVVNWLLGESGFKKDVALLCWEKNPEECHRLKIAEWLKENGYEVEEFGSEKFIQPELFD